MAKTKQSLISETADGLAVELISSMMIDVVEVSSGSVATDCR